MAVELDLRLSKISSHKSVRSVNQYLRKECRMDETFAS